MENKQKILELLEYCLKNGQINEGEYIKLANYLKDFNKDDDEEDEDDESPYMPEQEEEYQLRFYVDSANCYFYGSARHLLDDKFDPPIIVPSHGFWDLYILTTAQDEECGFIFIDSDFYYGDVMAGLDNAQTIIYPHDNIVYDDECSNNRINPRIRDFFCFFRCEDDYKEKYNTTLLNRTDIRNPFIFNDGIAYTKKIENPITYLFNQNTLTYAIVSFNEDYKNDILDQYT